MTERDREPREPGGAGEITTIMEGLLFLLLIFTLYEYLLSEREAVCKKENFKLEILKVVKRSEA